MALSKADKDLIAGLEAKISERDEKLVELGLKVAQAEQRARWASDRAEKAEREVRDLHDLLDTLGAVKRTIEGCHTDRPAMTRLAAYLSGARHQQGVF